MESLADQLNYYSQHESFKTLISEGQDEMVNALYNLEEDWREILELSGKLFIFSQSIKQDLLPSLSYKINYLPHRLYQL